MLYNAFASVLISLYVTLSCQPSVFGLDKDVTLPGGQKLVPYTRGNVQVFYGIPYAKPPVDDLRFQAPKESDPNKEIKTHWGTMRDCYKHEPSDFEIHNQGIAAGTSSNYMSEDCLYLDIYRPYDEVKNYSALPVLIWLDSMEGYSRDLIKPFDLFDRGDLILVVVKYRVGVFGNLVLNSSDGQVIAEGNQGLKDIILAIKYVHEIICHFGGSASEITVGGHSLGAASASAIWLSPEISHIVKRVVLQSGTTSSRWGFSRRDEAIKNGKTFATYAGCSLDDSVEKIKACLNKLKAENILNLTLKVQNEHTMNQCNFLENHGHEKEECNGHTLQYNDAFKPHVDSEVIPEEPIELLRKKTETKAQLMLGVTENEAMLYLLAGLKDVFGEFLLPNGSVVFPDKFFKAANGEPDPKTEKTLDLQDIIVQYFLDEKYLNPAVAKLPAAFYGIPKPDSKLFIYELLEGLEKLISDMDFDCPTLNFAETAARNPNIDVFLYRFKSRSMSKPLPEWVGSHHGSDIAYLFNRGRDVDFFGPYYPLYPNETKLANQMVDNLIHFVHKGDPNVRGSLKWLRYIPKSKYTIIPKEKYLYRKAPENSELEEGMRKSQCRFWLQTMETLIKHYPPTNGIKSPT